MFIVVSFCCQLLPHQHPPLFPPGAQSPNEWETSGSIDRSNESPTASAVTAPLGDFSVHALRHQGGGVKGDPGVPGMVVPVLGGSSHLVNK